jgi:hypothetical protein
MLFTLLTFRSSPRPDAAAPTILGWTPGLRALLEGRVLPCGCLVGLYLTWRGDAVTIVDAHAPRCPHTQHRDDAII